MRIGMSVEQKGCSMDAYDCTVSPIGRRDEIGSTSFAPSRTTPWELEDAIAGSHSVSSVTVLQVDRVGLRRNRVSDDVCLVGLMVKTTRGRSECAKHKFNRFPERSFGISSRSLANTFDSNFSWYPLSKPEQFLDGDWTNERLAGGDAGSNLSAVGRLK